MIYFFDCASLTSLTVPKNIYALKNFAFYKCGKLETITYKGTKAEWAQIAFGENVFLHCASSLTVHCFDGEISYTP